MAAFAPLATFEERFDEMLREVVALGYRAIDLWSAHLHYSWATPEHVAIARALLQEHRIAVTSYASAVGANPAELRAACRLCAELNIPIIATGFLHLFREDKTTTVSILRDFGIMFAFENHPEGSAEEVLRIIGEGDEDVVGVALDTGWCGTQKWDALQAVKDLWPRLKAVHLKDVKAPRGEPTGKGLIDMGHETCALGDGVAPVREVLELLVQRGFRGPIGIEHEPETHDPRPELEESLKRAQGWLSKVEVTAPFELRVVVVGCGNIANAYGEALRERPEIRIMGACDIDTARAASWVQQHGGRVYSSLDEALRDTQVDAIVNLTIQQAHVEVVTRALTAGKHVHSEKPLAPTYAEAKALVDLAETKGLLLSCAPVTWLGEAQQTAWKLIREGNIGEPRVAYASVDWGRIESWHPNPAPFYAVGPVFDVGIYPITLLTAWFGPVRHVTAGGGILLPERKTLNGEPYTIEAHNFSITALEFESGLIARLTASFYVGEPAENRSMLEVHGDLGSVNLDWMAATAPVRLGKFGESYKRVPPVRPALRFIDWSAGVAGLARAVRTGEPLATTGAQAAHVVQVIEGVHRSISEGRRITVKSRFAPPAMMPWAEAGFPRA